MSTGPAPGATTAVVGTLPLQLTSFIGRERETAEVRRLLGSTRLLTLTGAGGCGKTRLALRVAADLADAFPNGVRFVELAPPLPPALTAQAVAVALGVRDEPSRGALDRLVEELRPKALLLVLDNCEHLVAAIARLTDILLRSCPDLTILATSREPLGGAGETTWRVPSLSVPTSEVRAWTSEPERADAVRLFVARATAMRPGFVMTDENTEAVAEICRRLDGIPLALELAAARIKVLSVEQIAARLDDRFRLLTTGQRTAVPRHQTLQAAMDWSYDLLSAPERALLGRLSVFAGGWTFEAAEAVGAGDGIQPYAVLDLLTQLVDKSLVIAEEQRGAARYRMLETIRQYGHERLLASGEADRVRDRHLAYFVRFAEEAEPTLRASEQRRALDRLEEEHDNLRAALEWSLTGASGLAPQSGVAGRSPVRRGLGNRLGGVSTGVSGRSPDRRGLGNRPGSPTQENAALQLCCALAWFWWARGYNEEGRRWPARALAASGGRSAARMKALYGAGWLAHHQRDPTTRQLLSESLSIARELSDRWAVAWVLHIQGRAAYFENDPVQARALGAESLAIAEEVGDPWLIAWALHLLGLAAHIAADYSTARVYYARSLAIRREIGYQEGISILSHLMGIIAFREGDYAQADRLFREHLLIQQELGYRWHLSMALACFSGLAVAQGQPARAVRLAGAAAALSESYRALMYPPAEAVLADALEQAGRALDTDAYAAAWAEGQAMSLEEGITEAYAIQQAVPEATPRAGSVEPQRDGPFAALTATEVRVLQLLAGGLTTKEIAGELVVAISTVDRHITHIYEKLGVRNRTEATAIALKHGLA